MADYLGETIVPIECTPFAAYTLKDWVLYFATEYATSADTHHGAWIIGQVAQLAAGADVEIHQAHWANGHAEWRVEVKETEASKKWLSQYPPYEDAIAP